MHSLRYNGVDINSKSVQMKTQIRTKLAGRYVVGGASKTEQRTILLTISG